MEEEIIQTFQRKISCLDKNDLMYEAKKEYFENKMDEELDAVESFEKSKTKRTRKFKDNETKIEECQDPRKTKMDVEFNDREAGSIKSLAVKSTTAA